MLLPGDRESATTGHHVDEATPTTAPVGLLVVAVLCVVGFGSFLAEGAVADWGAVFLHENVGTSDAFAALGLTVFSGSMAICRLIADRVGVWLGPVVVARLGAGIGLAGFAIFLLVPVPAIALAGFALAGFGIGPVVPIVFSAAGNTRTEKRASLLGPAVSAGYVGAVIGPVAIGAVAERLSLSWALCVPVLFLVVVIVSAGLLARASGGVDSETKAHAHGPPHADG
jgi:MFS family permease